MKYNELSLTAYKNKRRVGRGIAAGQGKTAGRGTKGQGARAGSSRKPGFEGGQNPLMQRLPKLGGFRSHRPKITNVSTSQLKLSGQKLVDNFSLAKAGLVPSPHVKVKLLADGEADKAYEVKLQAASAAAIQLVTKAGGTFQETPQVKRQPKAK